MGLRVRKSIKLLPGIHLNLSKSGTSLSVGPKGASVNINSKGTRTTVGIPGTGISHINYSKHKTSTPHSPTKTITTPSNLKDSLSIYIVLGMIIGGAIGGIIFGPFGMVIGALLCTIAMVVVGEKDESKPPGLVVSQTKQYTYSQNKMPSSTDPSTSYTISKNNLTCTCPDFQERRSHFDVTDPRRLCKHLVKVVCEQPSLFEHYQTYKEYLGDLCSKSAGFLTKPKRNLIAANNKDVIAIFTEENLNDFNDGEGVWMDVFYLGKKHGYNPLKNIWTRTFEKCEERDDITRFIRKEICKYDAEFVEGI